MISPKSVKYAADDREPFYLNINLAFEIWKDLALPLPSFVDGKNAIVYIAYVWIAALPLNALFYLVLTLLIQLKDFIVV